MSEAYTFREPFYDEFENLRFWTYSVWTSASATVALTMRRALHPRSPGAKDYRKKYSFPDDAWNHCLSAWSLQACSLSPCSLPICWPGLVDQSSKAYRTKYRTVQNKLLFTRKCLNKSVYKIIFKEQKYLFIFRINSKISHHRFCVLVSIENLGYF